jgi:transglutaminase-like putative cysteine protease
VRFGLVHRIMTDALAVLGILAVVSTATLGTGTTIALLAGLALALALPESWQTKPFFRHLGTSGVLALFVVQVGRVFFGQSALDIAIEFAALLQVLRIATRRGAAHDQQIIVLALLHLVAGTVLGGGLAYGLCFLGFLVVAPGALVLSHLRREVEGNYRQGARDRTGLPVDVPRILRSRRVVGRGFLLTTCLLSVPIFVFTATLFVLFPRVGLSLLLLNHPRHGRMVGFSDKVDLGQVGTLRSDPSLALRFELDVPDPPPPRMTIRLRGTAFDSYDGRAWARSSSERRPAERTGRDLYPLVRTPDPIRDRKISFDLEPIDPPVVFLPPKAVAVRVKVQSQAVMSDPVTLQRGPEGELRYTGADTRGLRYEVYLANDGEIIVEPLPKEDRARYLELPKLPERVAALAHTWADPQPTARLKAKAIEEHLKTDYGYDVTSPSGGTEQPIDHFLFESRRGHCEFFSTAMAVMLREVGVPSRNVTGFVGGTYNRFGRYYAVREGDAHSWVEAYIDDGPHSGWVTFDPTPTAAAQPLEPTTGTLVYVRDLLEAMSQRWNRYVVGYDIQTQVQMFREVSRGYESARRSAGLDKGLAGKLTRAPVIAGAILVLGVGGYLVWARRGRRKPGDKRDAGSAKRKELEAAAELYRELEAALSAIGASRPAATPPLRHADGLVSRKHPLAREVHALTERYLAARFGGEPFSATEARDFRARVKGLRQPKPASAEA